MPEDDLNEYNEWFKITFILWGMNEYKIWEKWSRKSSKYDEKKEQRNMGTLKK